MKKIITLLFLSFFISVNAQLKVGNASLDFGETITTKDGSVIYIAGIINNTIYTLAKKDKKYFLQTFENSTKAFISSTLLKFDKINGNRVTIEDVVVIEDKAYVTASYYDKKAKTNNFFAKEINGSELIGERIDILSVNVPSKKRKGGFLFSPSYDEINYFVSHVGIIEKKETLTYSFSLLDKSMTSIFKDDYEIIYEDRKDLFFDFSDFAVNNQGDIFITTTESYRDKKNKTTVNNITVHSYLAENNYKKNVLNISLEGKRAINCNIIETKDNKLHAIGFYSDLKSSGRAEKSLEGIYDIAVDFKNNAVIKETFNEFTFDVKKKLLGERRAKKGKDLKLFYRNINLVERDNGGVIVLSEFFYSYVGRSGGIGPLSFTPITYFANEIIVTALKADGTLDWSNVIPKEQKVTVQELSIGFGAFASNGNVTVSASVMFPLTVLGKGPEYLSAMPLYHNGRLIVIVNDDPKNIGITEMDDVKKVRNVNKMIPVAFVFDEQNGAMKRIDPEDFEKRQIVVQPVTNYRLDSNNLIIYGSNKKGARLGELKLK